MVVADDRCHLAVAIGIWHLASAPGSPLQQPALRSSGSSSILVVVGHVEVDVTDIVPLDRSFGNSFRNVLRTSAGINSNVDSGPLIVIKAGRHDAVMPTTEVLRVDTTVSVNLFCSCLSSSKPVLLQYLDMVAVLFGEVFCVRGLCKSCWNLSSYSHAIDKPFFLQVITEHAGNPIVSITVRSWGKLSVPRDAT